MVNPEQALHGRWSVLVESEKHRFECYAYLSKNFVCLLQGCFVSVPKIWEMHHCPFRLSWKKIKSRIIFACKIWLWVWCTTIDTTSSKKWGQHALCSGKTPSYNYFIALCGATVQQCTESMSTLCLSLPNYSLCCAQCHWVAVNMIWALFYG